MEEGLKRKYLKLINLEEIIHSIIKDFQFNFIKEIILLFYLFTKKDIMIVNEIKDEVDNVHEESKVNIDVDKESTDINPLVQDDDNNQTTISTITETKSFTNPDYEKNLILKFINDGNVELKISKEEESYMIDILSKYSESKLSKSYLNMFINQLNGILYIMEEISYNNFHKYSSTHYYENKINEVYRITILSFAFCGKIEKILKDIGYTNLENLNLYSMINNYKKSFSKLIAKVSNDIFKSSQKLKQNFIQILGNDSALNESYLNKTLFHYYTEYAKILEFYSEFIDELSKKDRDALHPRLQNSFRIIFEFFDDIDFNNDKYFVIYFKILNIIHNNLKTFIQYQSLIDLEINHLLENSNKVKKFIVEYINKNVFQQINFEEKLRTLQSSDQLIEVIKEIIEKCKKNIVCLIMLNYA